jgi:hypothetical protein
MKLSNLDLTLKWRREQVWVNGMSLISFCSLQSIAGVSRFVGDLQRSPPSRPMRNTKGTRRDRYPRMWKVGGVFRTVIFTHASESMGRRLESPPPTPNKPNARDNSHHRGQGHPRSRPMPIGRSLKQFRLDHHGRGERRPGAAAQTVRERVVQNRRGAKDKRSAADGRSARRCRWQAESHRSKRETTQQARRGGGGQTAQSPRSRARRWPSGRM